VPASANIVRPTYVISLFPSFCRCLSQISPKGVKFTLQRINELEVKVLSLLNYNVKVPASEYAKYYFLMRSMLIKSGLGTIDDEFITPLDVEGAKRLQQLTYQYPVNQSTAGTLQGHPVGSSTPTSGKPSLPLSVLARSRSVGTPAVGAQPSAKSPGMATSSFTASTPKSKQAGLEDVVKL
jgi:hypothetical protein